MQINPAALESTRRYRRSTRVSHRRAVERVISHMRRRLGEELTLEEMSDIAAMSPFHFERTFRHLTSIPPGQFLSALRIERAKHLLLTTDDSVTEICFEVGYSSLGTFTSRFTQLIGLAPGQLRRLARGFTLGRIGDLLLEVASEPATAVSITGRIEAPANFQGLIFLGLFDKPIPQERPQSCAILAQPGDFRLNSPGDGSYFLFSAALAWSGGSFDTMLQEEAIHTVAAAGPVSVIGETVTGVTDLQLSPLDPLDPPLLVTLPLLLHERHERLEQDHDEGPGASVQTL